jgi:flagellar assembly factor FliW
MNETTSTARGTELLFTDGIPGFPDLHRFVLVDVVPDGAFQELRSVEDPSVSMIVCVPWLFFPDYAPEVPEDDREELDLRDPEEAVVFCPVTLDDARDAIYVNLFGPFVVNASSRRGRQLVLTDSGYPLRARLELESA